MESKVFDKHALKTLNYWISERESIRRKKVAGEPKPWTKDPILRDHRWCNVRRMDDKVSVWLRDHWYGAPLPASRDTLAAATLARLLNWPDSLVQLGSARTLFDYAPKYIIKALKEYRDGGGKVFTGAYIINGRKGEDKIDTVVRQMCDVHAKAPISNGKFPTDYMCPLWEFLQTINGIGSFMAGQIVADVRWAVRGAWDDRFDWAPVGPGSARGMRRVLGLPYQGVMPQKQFNVLLPALWDELMGFSEASEIFEERGCEAMDLQNCLCEFDKYMRLTNKEGSVRSGYPGMPESGRLL